MPSIAFSWEDSHTEAELVSEIHSIQPGSVFYISVRFRMDAGWHIYWKDPGDSGMPPKVEWLLPEGIKNGGFSGLA